VEKASSLQRGAVGAILQAILEIEPNSFVVGGAVRDYLLGKAVSNDLDIAFARNGLEVANRIVSLFPDGVTHVPLDEDAGASRIVIWKDVFFSLDMSMFKGADIYEDLARRDFTINAMAIPLRDFMTDRAVEVVDPLDGLSDLSHTTIRACSERSFVDDPLRILRAYRFATLLDFKIADQTRALLKRSIPELPTVSGERVREELFFILCEGNASRTIDMITSDNVLDAIFPEMIPSRGCEQNDYHHLDVFDHSLETLRCLETVFTDLPQPLRPFEDLIMRYLDSEIVKGRPRKALLKLAALFHDLGKPSCLTIDASGRRRFSGHEVVSEEIVQRIADRLRMSRKEQKLLSQWVRGHMRGALLSTSPPPPKGVRRLCREFGEDVIGLLLLIIADRAATRGPRSKKSEIEAIKAGAATALECSLQSIEAPPPVLITGRDLMGLFGMEQGPEIGRILQIVRELQEEGTVTSRDEALSEVRRLLHQ